MREIRTSGLMSGVWRRDFQVTAPDLDSTVSNIQHSKVVDLEALEFLEMPQVVHTNWFWSR